MSRMTSDIENLQQLVQDGISQFALQGLTMIVITVILFTTNVALATWTVAARRAPALRLLDLVPPGLRARLPDEPRPHRHRAGRPERVALRHPRRDRQQPPAPQHRQPPPRGGRLPRRQHLHRPGQLDLRSGDRAHRHPGPGPAAGHRRRRGPAPPALPRRARRLLLVPEPVLRPDPAARPAVQLAPAGSLVDHPPARTARDPAQRRRGARRDDAAGARGAHHLRARGLLLRRRAARS